MKGISSHDGKMHGNVQMIDRYDQSKGKKQHAKPTGGESGGEHEAGGHDEIKSIVGEHGPAHKIHIEHDHDGQHSTVTSHHESGHVHTAEHDGEDHVAMAHAHAAHAGGEHDSEALHEAHLDTQGESEAIEKREEEISPGIHARAGKVPGFLPEHMKS